MFEDSQSELSRNTGLRMPIKIGPFDMRLVAVTVSLIIFLVVVQLGLSFIQPPRNFPVGALVHIGEGSSVLGVANQLADEGIIVSPRLFALFVLSGTNTTVAAGDYLFEQPQSVVKVAYRLSNADYGNSRVRLTIPEGSHNRDIAAIIQSKIPDFDVERFLELAEAKEGYLFPDTYWAFPSVTPEYLIAMMEENFDQQIAELQEQIDNSERPLEDIITMASIIEKEAFAGNYREHQIISGILWKRIRIGMPLQVDAPFKYLLDKASSELTLADLREDSPYNTYTRKGLPIGPINNPGLLAIRAALNPEESPYLFYLHDQSGTIHYAVDHLGHVANKRRYLD